jgi:hypothetical protein
MVNVDGRIFAMVEGKFKQKIRDDFGTQEYKFHDWWIEGERGPSAPLNP